MFSLKKSFPTSVVPQLFILDKLELQYNLALGPAYGGGSGESVAGI